MTIWMVLASLRRFWLLAIAGFLISAGAADQIADAAPTYSGRVQVLFLAPLQVDGQASNGLLSENESLISVAGIVARRVGDDPTIDSTLR